MKVKLKHILLVAFVCICLTTSGQQVAVKSNVLYDALLNINVGAEFGLAPRWTLDVSGDLNMWTLSHERRWKHWLLQPEARYWFCDRFSGHFLGFHAHGGQYNVGGLKTAFRSSAPTSRDSPRPAIRGGSSVPASPTAIPGFSAVTGISSWRSAWAMPIRVTTASAAPDAARGSRPTGRTTTWVRPRRR